MKINSNVNFATAGFGISIIIYLLLLSIGYLKLDIKKSKELKDEKKILDKAIGVGQMMRL